MAASMDSVDDMRSWSKILSISPPISGETVDEFVKQQSLAKDTSIRGYKFYLESYIHDVQAMYNGIGLETARGSGTNGYVQRNLAFIKYHKDKTDYKSEEELNKLDARLNKGPNEEILLHERKRKVELKCLEMQELMAETGYSQEEIEKKVAAYREKLMENQTNLKIETDETSGRPTAKASHQLAEASQARNENLREAFGISEFFKDGSSFDPERKAKEIAAKNLAIATKKYSIIEDESGSEDEKEVERKEQQKKKNTKRFCSQSSSEEKKSKKKRAESPEKKDKHHGHKSSHKSRKEK